MTGKAATKKKAGTAPQLKAQLANERAQNDNLGRQLGELIGLVKQGQENQAQMNQRINELAEQVATAPTKAAILAKHDPSARVISEVLNEEDEASADLPPKPEVVLPDHLRRGKLALETGEDMPTVPADEDSDVIEPIAARNFPRQIRQGVHSDDTEIGQMRDRPMKSTGLARDSLAPLRANDTGIVLENRVYSKDKMIHELFMHEMVAVRVYDTSDTTQTPFPESGNDGQMQVFARNKITWVQRKFIEPLARAKKTTYTQRQEQDSQGIKVIVQVPHTALLYPFEVIEDTPKGKRWLRNILAEPY